MTSLFSASRAFSPSPSRQAWALVSVIGGGNSSCSEDVREHENHDTGGRALARRNFTTADGVGFAVTAYSEWRNGERRACMCNGFCQCCLKMCAFFTSFGSTT